MLSTATPGRGHYHVCGLSFSMCQPMAQDAEVRDEASVGAARGCSSCCLSCMRFPFISPQPAPRGGRDDDGVLRRQHRHCGGCSSRWIVERTGSDRHSLEPTHVSCSHCPAPVTRSPSAAAGAFSAAPRPGGGRSAQVGEDISAEGGGRPGLAAPGWEARSGRLRIRPPAPPRLLPNATVAASHLDSYRFPERYDRGRGRCSSGSWAAGV